MPRAHQGSAVLCGSRTDVGRAAAFSRSLLLGIRTPLPFIPVDFSSPVHAGERLEQVRTCNRGLGKSIISQGSRVFDKFEAETDVRCSSFLGVGGEVINDEQIYVRLLFFSVAIIFFSRKKKRERERKIFNKKFDYRFFRDEYTGEYKLPRGGTGEFYIRRI